MAFTRTMIFWYTLSNFQEGNAIYPLPMFINPQITSTEAPPSKASKNTNVGRDENHGYEWSTPRNLAYHRTPKLKNFQNGWKQNCLFQTEVSWCWYKIFQRKSPPFTEFPSVLRFFGDGITQANAAPVTSSLPPSRWWQERWKVSYKLFELTGSVKNTWMKFLRRKKRWFRLFITSNKLLPPFFLSVALPPLLRGFFAPFFHLPTPRKEPKNWKNDILKWQNPLFQILKLWAYAHQTGSSNTHSLTTLNVGYPPSHPISGCFESHVFLHQPNSPFSDDAVKLDELWSFFDVCQSPDEIIESFAILTPPPCSKQKKPTNVASNILGISNFISFIDFNQVLFASLNVPFLE